MGTSQTFFRLLLFVCLLVAVVSTKAQTGIGIITPDADKALHVKSKLGQDPVRLEGLQVGTSETDFVVTDADGVLRYRPLADLEIQNEWEDDPTSTFIYARRAFTEGSPNRYIAITDAGKFGIGTTTPISDFHIATSNGGMTIGRQSSHDGDFGNEQIRLVASRPDVIISNINGTTVGPMIGYNTSIGSRYLQSGFRASRLLMGGASAAGNQVFRVEYSSTTGTAGNGISWRSGINLSNQGDFGIGTNSPTARLDVSGDARIRDIPFGVMDGDPLNDDYVLVTDRSNQGRIRKIRVTELQSETGEWFRSGSRIYARRAHDNPPRNYVTIDDEGRVGIGHNGTSTEKIDIQNGGIKLRTADFGISFNNETPRNEAGLRDGSRIYYDNTTSVGDALFIEKTDVNELDPDGAIVFSNRGNDNNREHAMVIEGSGRIGLSVDNPREKLHVLGDVLIQNGGLGNSASGGLLMIGDHNNISNNFADNKKGVYISDGRSMGYLGLDSISTNHQNTKLVFGRDRTHDFKIKHFDRTTERTLMHFDGNHRNVGIGIETPNSNKILDVNGQVRIRDFPVGSVTSDQVVTVNATGDLQKVNASDLFTANDDQDWTVSGNQIYNANTGNVGIGLTNPAYQLDIDGDLRLRGDNNLYFRDANTRMFSPSFGRINVVSRYETVFRNSSNSDVALGIRHDSRRVGIRTDAPAEELDVNGDVLVRNQHYLRFGTQSNNRIWAEGDDDFRLSALTEFSVRRYGDATATLTANTVARRVGVNQPNPQARLHVGGDVRIDYLQNLNNPTRLVSVEPSTGRLRSTDVTRLQGPWAYSTSSGGRITQRDLDARVGIGTTAPVSTFHIFEPVGTIPNTSRGSLTLQHGNVNGQSSIVFRSAKRTSDAAYISYQDDQTPLTSDHRSLLTIGVRGDAGTSTHQDHIAMMPSGFMGVKTTTPTRDFDVNGRARIRVMDPGVSTGATPDEVVSVNAAGDLRKIPMSVIKDNLGNHIATQNIDLGTSNFISPDGTNQGLKLGAEGSLIATSRFQIGNAAGVWYDDVISGVTPGFAGNDGALFAPIRTGSETSDLRLYILDNSNDAFSIWGNPCGTTNCGDINGSSRVARFRADGQITFDRLATGGADMMVTVDANGLLGTAVIPGSGGGGTADNLGNHTATTNVRLGSHAVTFDGSANQGFRISSDGNMRFVDGRVLFWNSLFHSRIVGNVNEDNQGGNNDLVLEGRDDVFLRSRGSAGDIQLRASDDIFAQAEDLVTIRSRGSSSSDIIRFQTRSTDRASVRNNGDFRVNNLSGAGFRMVVADADGDLSTRVFDEGLWDRDVPNEETFLRNTDDNVGIGTANPRYKLEVSQATTLTNSASILINSKNGSGSASLIFDGRNNRSIGYEFYHNGQNNNFTLRRSNALFSSTPATALKDYITVEYGGDVGIGVSDPRCILHLAEQGGIGTTNATEIIIQNKTVDGSSQIRFVNGNSTSGSMILRNYQDPVDADDDAMQMMNGGTPIFSVKRTTGQITSRGLRTGTGNGTRMVVSDENGVLSTRVFDQELWDRSTSGNRTYLANNVDNVGIGTTNPTAKLHVNGTLRVQNIPAGANSDFIVSADANGNIRRLSISTFENFWERDALSGNTFTANTSDNVGIGTSSPAQKLDVNGQVRIQNLPAGSAATDEIVVADANGDLKTIDPGVFDTPFDRDAANNYVFPLDLSDWLGIGTNTPEHELHVVGEAQISSLAGTGTRSVVTDANGVLSTLPIPEELWSRDVANLTTYLTNGGDNLGLGLTAATEKLDVNGKVRIRTLDPGADTDDVLVADATGVLKKIDADEFKSVWTRDAVDNEIYPKTLTDRVGIGTTAPEEPLHLHGNTDTLTFRISNRRHTNSVSRIKFRRGTSIEGVYSMSLRYNGTANAMEIANGEGESLFSVHRVGSSGRIGIGMLSATPSQKLEIHSGNIKIATNGYGVYFQESESYLRDSGSGIRLSGSDHIDFRTNGNRRMYIYPDGRTRIYNLPNGSVNDKVVVADVNGILRTRTMGVTPWSRDPATGRTRLVNASDRVGIGTSFPGYKLDVNGDLRVRGSNRIIINNSNQHIRRNSDDQLEFYSTTDVLYDTENIHFEDDGNKAGRFDLANARFGFGDVLAPQATVHIRSTNTAAVLPLKIDNLADANSGNNWRNLLINSSNGYVMRSTTVVDQSGTEVITSDRRLKKDIQPLQGVLKAFDVMSAVSYKYDTTVTDLITLDSMTHYGMIAQEVKEHFPHAVREVEGYLHLNYNEMMGVFLAANKELIQKNKELEEQVKQLKNTNESLTTDVSDMKENMSKMNDNINALMTLLKDKSEVKSADK